MKIEMGESLMMSWLKHVKGCQFSQLNWKAASSWKEFDKAKVKDIFETINKMGKILTNKDTNLFKEANFEQTITQAEIDILGYNFETKKLYAVDVAYHEQGLRYDELVRKVLMKMIRSALILKLYFGVSEGEIIFASPKINPKDFNELNEKFELLKGKDFRKNFEDFNFEFSLYGNKKFNDEIYQKTIEISNKIADTSELFMRSIQLNNLLEKMFSSNKK